MIVLDTNIISEMMKETPALPVIKWLDQQPPSYLHITTITIAEIQYGLSALPQSKRRNNLDNAFTSVLNAVFKYRILDFDEASAHAYGEIMGRRKQLGKPMSILDGQIAAITQVKGMQLATRNTADFQGLGLRIINPFL